MVALNKIKTTELFRITNHLSVADPSVDAVKSPVEFPAGECSKLEVGAEHCGGGLQRVGACLGLLGVSSQRLGGILGRAAS